tara:strand:+ start:311 stop:442 length:132 start_codon:yes stop_codon:yes gene_type:complete
MKEKLSQDLKKQLEEAQKKLEDKENDKIQLLESHENEKKAIAD